MFFDVRSWTSFNRKDLTHHITNCFTSSRITTLNDRVDIIIFYLKNSSYKWWYLCMWWRRSHLRASFCLDSLLNKTQFADHLNIEELRLACNPSQFQMDLLKTISPFYSSANKPRDFIKSFAFRKLTFPTDQEPSIMKTKSDLRCEHCRQTGRVFVHWPVEVHSRHFEPIRF